MNFKVILIDIESEGMPLCILNKKDALDNGVTVDDYVVVINKEFSKVFQVTLSNDIVAVGHICLPKSITELEGVNKVQVHVGSPTTSLKVIRKKIKGKKLSYEDSYSLMKDISADRLNDIGKTYFASLGYNPGFDQEEIYNLTKAMASTGEMIKFKGNVVDKHSIGGVPGKGITPIVVSIVSACGLTIPNTSTRAITTPAGTADILEVIMKISFTKKEIVNIVDNIGACLVWGGSLAIAPADDKLIKVERLLNIESYDKFLISIMAKKVAMGINHLVLDFPVGINGKIKSKNDIKSVKYKFENLAYHLGINIYISERTPNGIDGNGVGPKLEVREFLKVLEQREDRSINLEKDALILSAKLLELSGKYKVGEGLNVARKTLISLSSLKKFKEIVKYQSGNPDINSDDIELSKVYIEFESPFEGTIEQIYDNKLVMITKILGAPQLKDAGIYFHKNVGDKVFKGEKLLTVYSVNKSRLNLITLHDLANIFNIKTKDN